MILAHYMVSHIQAGKNKFRYLQTTRKRLKFAGGIIWIVTILFLATHWGSGFF
jgi:hypothetical protein